MASLTVGPDYNSHFESLFKFFMGQLQLVLPPGIYAAAIGGVCLLTVKVMPLQYLIWEHRLLHTRVFPLQVLILWPPTAPAQMMSRRSCRTLRCSLPPSSGCVHRVTTVQAEGFALAVAM